MLEKHALTLEPVFDWLPQIPDDDQKDSQIRWVLVQIHSNFHQDSSPTSFTSIRCSPSTFQNRRHC